MSIPLFIAGWFLHGGKGGDEPLWEVWRVLITHDYLSESGMAEALIVYTLGLAIPAVVLGWVLHLPVAFLWECFRRRRRNEEQS
jgi:hypothetical protein